ncbi:MAG TPA: TasA family protein [Nocardioidaceae bacterium]|nr:TasA family protein [Nocardioidaceae bacterium]
MTSSTTTRRKILVPLATLLAAGAIAVGSGATFTSTSQNVGSSYTTGTLKQTNSQADSAIFDLDNLKPGDTLTGTVTITNSGTLPAAFELTEGAVVNEFDDHLTMTVTEGTTPVWSGSFGTLATQPLGDAAWAAGEAHTYTFAVSLDDTAGNEYQDKTAGATYTWNAVQTDGETRSTS